jgi:hypothetical protein
LTFEDRAIANISADTEEWHGRQIPFDFGESIQVVVTDHGSTQPLLCALTGLAKADADRQPFAGRV